MSGFRSVLRSRPSRGAGTVGGLGFGLLITLAPVDADATTPAPLPGTFKVCLKQNMSGFADLSSGDRATQTSWGLHGIYTQVRIGTSVVRNWGAVDKDDGCFLQAAIGVTGYTVDIATMSGTLSSANTVVSRGSNGNIAVVSAAATMGQALATYNVTMPSNDTARVYAALVFFIERAFRGRYEEMDLTSWIGDGGNQNPCVDEDEDDFTGFCTAGGKPHISLGLGQTFGDAHARKFVVAHEFGHANHFGGADPSFWNVCTLGGAGHQMRGPEWSSCAASEGWAHFYAGDVFNWHDPGTGSSNPQAEFHYIDDGIFSLGDGSGDCFDPPFDYESEYPDNSPRKMYIDCHGGAWNPAVGTEIDWARHWWDYHEDTNKGGSERSHAQLHDDIAAAGTWSTADAYETMRDGLSSALEARWTTSASWNGICVAGSSC